MRYAQSTSVPVDRSRTEIERTLGRYGASAFAYATDNQKAYIKFKMNNRVLQFILDLPDFESFRTTPAGRRKRSDADTYKSWEQACRQKWRALALVIKAKLESVESEISVFEKEFMANILLPSGESVGDWMAPQIEHAYATGKMPKLLPGPESQP
jgi:hypothetical protein